MVGGENGDGLAGGEEDFMDWMSNSGFTSSASDTDKCEDRERDDRSKRREV